jgi:hypothetical protein
MAFLETRTLQVAVDLVRARDQTWRELLLREQDLHEQTFREREQTLRKREQAFLEQTTGSHTPPITRSTTQTQETISALEKRVDGLARKLKKARGGQITELRGQEIRFGDRMETLRYSFDFASGSQLAWDSRGARARDGNSLGVAVVVAVMALLLGVGLNCFVDRMIVG